MHLRAVQRTESWLPNSMQKLFIQANTKYTISTSIYLVLAVIKCSIDLFLVKELGLGKELL